MSFKLFKKVSLLKFENVHILQHFDQCAASINRVVAATVLVAMATIAV